MKRMYWQVLSLLLIALAVPMQAQNLNKTIDEQIVQLVENNKLSNLQQNWEVTAQHTSSVSGIHHVYFRQMVNGLPVFGSNSSVHLDAEGNLLKFNNRFIDKVQEKAGAPAPALNAAQSIEAAADQLGYQLSGSLSLRKTFNDRPHSYRYSEAGISLSEIPVSLVYTADDAGNIKLAWDLSIEAVDKLNWWSVRIDAQDGQLINQDNWVSSCNFEHTHDHECDGHDQDELNYNENLYNIPNFDEYVAQQRDMYYNGVMVESYEVIALPIESPYFGARTIETLPFDATASPFGWHDTNGAAGAEYTDTRGNNCNAYEDGDNPGYRPDAGPTLAFTGYPFSQTYTPANQYEDAAITNLFYWTNIIHDVLYLYGFDEASGNFQDNNYGNGGSGNDWVRSEAQDGSGTCNANFATPPDGSLPRMQMYVCNDKDGDFDNLVIIHEYGHGISNRLTGGPGAAGCLGNQEQMGEGWSDWYGVVMTMQPGDLGTDARPVGTYLFGQGPGGSGIRPYPYSTNMAVNPQTYDDIKTASIPHGVGSVWSTMLWEMTWELIDEYGWDADIYNFTGDVNQDAGNVQAIALVTEGMKLQPCSPGFIDGRDAILAADLAIYGGANQCRIWDAFARRGLGFSADQGSSGSRSDGTEAFDTPSALADFTAPADVCENEPVMTGLGGGTPTGGVYSGTGVTDDGNGLTYSFDPAVAGVGIHVITYEVPAGPCAVASSDNDSIEVLGIPGAPPTTGAPDFCLGSDITVSAVPANPANVIRWYDDEIGGNFLFEGNDYTFTPAGAGSVWAQETPPVPLSQLKISEVTLQTPDRLEIQNVGLAEDYSGYLVASSDSPYNDINTVNPVVQTLGAMGADSVVHWDDQIGSPNYWGSNLFWNDNETGWIIILDDTGNVVDSVFWNLTAGQISGLNVNIGGFNVTAADLDWTGAGASFTLGCTDSYRRIGDTDNATNWANSCEPSDYGVANGDISIGIAGCLGARGEATYSPDAELPTISCAAPVTVSTDVSGCEATAVSLTDPTTGDNCGIATLTNDAPAVFPLGDTTVTWTVTDTAGNQATCQQIVTVVDDIAPVVDCPATVEVSTDADSCVATNVVLGTPGVDENCAIDTVISDAPAEYPIGTTIVTWTVTDLAGNQASCTQEVIVFDGVAPEVDCPAVVTVGTDPGSCSAANVNIGDPVAEDNCGIDSITNDAPAIFELGETEVTWTITDTAGNQTTCTQIIVVEDTEDPEVICPQDIFVTVQQGETYELPDFSGEVVMADNCTVDLGYQQTPPAGTEIGVGNNVITILVEDDAGNTASCEFSVIVDTVLGIGTNELSDQLIVYPNPTTSEVFISNPNGLDLQRITLIDVNGRIVERIDGAGSLQLHQIQVDRLASGVYFIKIDAKDATMIQQLIKN